MRDPVRVTFGWLSRDLPLALPATWNFDAGTLRLAPHVAALADVTGTGPASVTLDAGDDDLRGVLLRGEATVTSTSAGEVALAFTPARLTWWEGTRSDTVDASN